MNCQTFALSEEDLKNALSTEKSGEIGDTAAPDALLIIKYDENDEGYRVKNLNLKEKNGFK